MLFCCFVAFGVDVCWLTLFWGLWFNSVDCVCVIVSWLVGCWLFALIVVMLVGFGVGYCCAACGCLCLTCLFMILWVCLLFWFEFWCFKVCYWFVIVLIMFNYWLFVCLGLGIDGLSLRVGFYYLSVVWLY